MKKIIALSLIVLSSVAFAQGKPNVSYSMPAVEVGFKWNSMDVTGASSNKQAIGFQLGVSTVFDFTPTLGLKTGLFYSERPFEFDSLGVNYKGKVTYFEVPAFFMFKFEEYAGVYVGPSLAIKMGSEKSPGTINDVNGMIVPITFGAQFKFLPNLGINVFFETVPGEVAKGVKNSRAVGANLLIAFD